jgi:hypothetical protein
VRIPLTNLSERNVARLALFSLPVLFWLAGDIYLLWGALSHGCGPPPIEGRGEVDIALALWNFPILAGLVLEFLPFNECTTAGFVGVWLVCCIAGLVQWYLILGGWRTVLRRVYHHPLFNRDHTE